MLRALSLLALTLLFASAIFAQGEYVIDRFHVDVEMRKDATIKVHEEITATFNIKRRGIIRKIPIVAQLGDGRERAIHLNNISVTDPEGNNYTTEITREGNYLQIRIGDADIFFRPGTSKTYNIEYEVYGALNWFADDGWNEQVELYWNITGTEWDATIDNASFSISYPKVAETEQLKARVFAGAYGTDFSIIQQGLGTTENVVFGLETTVTDSGITGSSSKSLAAALGMTAVVFLPASAVPKPTQLEEFKRRVMEYLPFLTPIVIAIVFFFCWLFIGRDEKDGPTQVRFEPPTNLPAAEAGAMIDERVDKRDISAGIMSLIIKGYYTVEPKEIGREGNYEEFTLRITKKTDKKGLSKFEDQLYGLLQDSGGTVTQADLRRHVGPSISLMRATIYHDLAHRGFYPGSPDNVRSTWIFFGIIASGVISYLLGQMSLIHEIWIMVVGGALGIIPASLLGWQMPRRTRRGSKTRRQLLGFYEMMRHRENYMAWVVETQPDGLKYEEYLPYAVAFDLIDEWNDAFKDILTEPPSWYHGTYAGGFMMHSFAHDLTHMTSDIGNAAGTPPRSDGGSGGNSGFSSGGGFSGGGFGGGGGSSW